MRQPGSQWARFAGGAVAAALWLSLCVWLFAFSYSDSYFRYSHCSRIPVFAAAMIGATAIPVGALLVWRRFKSALGVIVGQVGVSLVALGPLSATSFVLSRIRGDCRLSADDAMGAGIDFLLLVGIAAAFVALLAVASLIRSRRRDRDRSG